MDTIINFILDNLFFVIIVLFGLINLFGRSQSEQSEERQKRERRPVPTQRQNVPQQKVERRVEQQPLPVDRQETFENTTIETKSIEEQRQEQYERLRRQFQTDHSEADLQSVENFRSTVQTPEVQQTTQKENVPLILEKRLTQKGLIESVIMAEVLGPPKARQKINNRYHRFKY